MTWEEANKTYLDLVDDMEDDKSNITYTAIIENENGFGIETGKKPLDGINQYHTKFLRENLKGYIQEYIRDNYLDFSKIEYLNGEGFISKYDSAELLVETSLPLIRMCEKTRPLRAGVSIGSNAEPEKKGTLGCFFSVQNSKHVFFLTCQHVMSPNDNLTAQGRFNLHQPASKDYQYINGEQLLFTVGETFKTGVFEDTIDASIGYLKKNIPYESGIYNLTNKLAPQPEIASIMDPVIKTGRSSGLTKGIVLSINASIKVRNPKFTEGGKASKYLVFRDQIMTQSMALPGDSGSVLLNDNHAVVGLTFAKIDFSLISGLAPYMCNLPLMHQGRTFHNKIENILSCKKLFKNFKFNQFK